MSKGDDPVNADQEREMQVNPVIQSRRVTIRRRQSLSKAIGGLTRLAGIAVLSSAPQYVSNAEKTTARHRTEDNTRRKIMIAAVAAGTLDGILESNYARALRMAEISLAHKPDIILLPEAFAAGHCRIDLAHYAEDGENSEHLAKFRRLSAEAGCMIVFGYPGKVADPLFVDPPQGDFRLNPDSPAFTLGFRPLDLSQVGPRPRSRPSR